MRLRLSVAFSAVALATAAVVATPAMRVSAAIVGAAPAVRLASATAPGANLDATASPSWQTNGTGLGNTHRRRTGVFVGGQFSKPSGLRVLVRRARSN